MYPMFDNCLGINKDKAGLLQISMDRHMLAKADVTNIKLDQQFKENQERIVDNLFVCSQYVTTPPGLQTPTVAKS